MSATFYRSDEDLKFLAEIKSPDLDNLVYCLVFDTDGEKRFTEELSTSDDYQRYYPDHQKYWKLIATELQRFGGNTLVNLMRFGEGVLYKEILMDVCDKLKVNYNRNSSAEKIELNLLMKILSDALEKMSPQELKDLGDAIGANNLNSLNAEAFLLLFQAVFRAGGFKSYQLTLIIVNAISKALIGRGLSFAGNATLTKTMSILTGPIGMTIMGLLTVIDIAGAAYRVTIPAVIQVAALRQKHKYENENLVAEVSFG